MLADVASRTMVYSSDLVQGAQMYVSMYLGISLRKI